MRQGRSTGRRPWLSPLAVVYGSGAALRVALYRRGLLRQSRLRGPVISVGNLSVGGSGKTPVVARAAEILRAEGLSVAILSRGYGGSFRGQALVVGDGESVLAEAAVAGDEPVMLARSLPGVVVAVGRRRDEVGRIVEERFGAQVHILDDGFQHLRLARDLDLLCLDLSDVFDWPLPSGRLREFPSAAQRADILLLEGSDGDGLAASRHDFGPERTFRFVRRVEGFFDLEGGARLSPFRPFLLSGIARPDRFEADVRSCVPEIVGHARFADHHAFSQEELGVALAHARSGGADALVTTAKDAVRLPKTAFDFPVLVFRIAAQIADEGRFRQRLLAVATRCA